MSALSPPPREAITEEDGQLSRAWDRWFRQISVYLRLSRHVTVTINPASVAAATSAEQDFTVSIATTQDIVTVNKPSLTAGIGIVNARVKSAGVVSITFMNATAGAIDPPSEAYDFILERK